MKKDLAIVLPMIGNSMEVMKKNVIGQISVHDKMEGTPLEAAKDTGLVRIQLKENSQIEAHIHIYRHGYEYDMKLGHMDAYKDRFMPFLEGIGVEWSEDVYFVIMVLHEIGHIAALRKATDYDCALDYHTLMDITEATVALALRDGAADELNEEGFNAAYFFNFAEAQADIYAISHFYPVWNLLKERELI